MDRQKLTETFHRYRWILVLVLVGALVAFGHLSGLTERLDSIPRVKSWVNEAGPWGVLLFVALFTLGELIHVPGLLFVFVAMLFYGSWVGILVSLLGAITSVSVSFLLIRLVGGQPLKRIRRPFLRKMLDHLDRRPIWTVFWLRIVLWLAPIVNYALAMSKVRFRDYFIGSVAGLSITVTLFGLFFDWIKTLEWFKQLL